MGSKSGLFAAIAGGVFAVGCAAPGAAEPETHRSVASHEEGPGGGGGGGGAIFLPVDDHAVRYIQAGDQSNVIVCKDFASADLLNQIQGSGATPNIVIAKTDGSYDARRADRPTYAESTLQCDGSGAAYIFRLFDWNVDFVAQDLSAAFVSGFSGHHWECDGGLSFARGLDIDVSGFRVENGTIHQPDVTVRFEGHSDQALTAHCAVTAETEELYAQAGPVPVFYKLAISVGVTVSLSQSADFSASIGTTGGSLNTNDGQLTITPDITLGVSFYGLVGGYVGVGFPITVTPQDNCTPDVTMGAQIKVGAEVGLLDLPISKALQVEVSSPVLGPWEIAAPRCN